MQYLLLIYGDESKMMRADEAALTKMSAAYGVYTQNLQKAGVLLGGERLRPVSTASTVRVTDGKTKVVNGPYAETKEQLAGYYVIDAPDLDAALDWAAKCPGAELGSMEVRPIWPMS
jgi:hypothetical protein